MAITIRKIENHRLVLDWYKSRSGIKTDSKALLSALEAYYSATAEIDELNALLERETKRADDSANILAGLEKYIAPALENIRQNELDI